MAEIANIVNETTAATTTPAKPILVQQQTTDPSVPAKTTFQEDLTTAGQRAVNLIWEKTQGDIARYVILGAMVINGITILAIILTLVVGFDISAAVMAAVMAAIGFVNSLATGVMSFYFSRTNHTQIGGTGDKPNEVYKGR